MIHPNADLPDMRGIPDTSKRFGLPEHLVRQLVISKKVVAIQAGRGKYYINQASMINYLNTGSGEVK